MLYSNPKLSDWKTTKIVGVIRLSPNHFFCTYKDNNYYNKYKLYNFVNRPQIAETSRKYFSFNLILSFNYILYRGRVYHEVTVTCIFTQIKIISICENSLFSKIKRVI